MKTYLTLSAIVILILKNPTYDEKVPLCRRIATGEMVPCYSSQKIDEAQRILGSKYDRDFIISIEINRGKFKNAKALADWIRYGD